MGSEKLAYTINEAAAAIAVSRATVYNMIADGDLVAHKARGRTVIKREVLESYLAGLPVMESHSARAA